MENQVGLDDDRAAQCFDCERHFDNEGLCSVYAALKLEELYDPIPVRRCLVCFKTALTYGTEPRRSRDIENASGMVAHTFCDETTSWSMPDHEEFDDASSTAAEGPTQDSPAVERRKEDGDDDETPRRDRSRSPRGRRRHVGESDDERSDEFMSAESGEETDRSYDGDANPDNN